MNEAIILAGGLGTRLSSVLPGIPKPMAPINGEPFLTILLNRLIDAGIERVVLSVGYKADVIREFFGQAFGVLKVDYVQEDVPLGTGGAVRRALRSCRSDGVVVLNGDSLVELDMHQLCNSWMTFGTPIVVARRVPDTTRYGRIETVDGVITHFAEKSVAGEGLINAGMYLFPRMLFDGADLEDPFSLENDFLAHEVHRRPIRVVEAGGYFIDIGIPEDYVRAQRELVAIRQ